MNWFHKLTSISPVLSINFIFLNAYVFLVTIPAVLTNPTVLTSSIFEIFLLRISLRGKYTCFTLSCSSEIIEPLSYNSLITESFPIIISFIGFDIFFVYWYIGLLSSISSYISIFCILKYPFISYVLFTFIFW